MPLSQTNVIGVFCVYYCNEKGLYCYHYRRGREKTKRRAKEQQSDILLHTTTLHNNKKHKTKAQRIDGSEADRVEH